MEEKKSRGRKTVLPAANSFTCYEASGWMFKFINEGWLRKRWRKRYCVLSSGILYSYEQQTAEGTEKTCGSLHLKFFKDCFKAPGKDCKKSPNTLILEPIKHKTEDSESSKNTNQIPREFFYTESHDELENWISKLKESISLSNIGTDSKLKHVTKSRARPPKGSGGNRRPPSKHHLKERAMMSDVAAEKSVSKKDPPKSRGSVPLAALRPPAAGTGGLQSTQTQNVVGTGSKASKDGDRMPFRSVPNPPPAALKPTSGEKNESSEKTATESSTTERSPIKMPAPPRESSKPSHAREVEISFSLNVEHEENSEIAGPEESSVSLLPLPAYSSNESIQKRTDEDASALEVSDKEVNGLLRRRQNAKDVKEENLPHANALHIHKTDRAKSMIILASESVRDLESSSNITIFADKEALICENAERKKPLNIRPSSLIIDPR